MSSEITLPRFTVLERYRRLREICIAHHSAAMRYVATSTILTHARALGIAKGKTLVLDSEDEMTLAIDLAMYVARDSRSCAIDRYRRAASLPAESDEARVLDAMCRSRFSIWRVERRHPIAGLIVFDILRETERWMVDSAFEASADEGVSFAARLSTPDEFSMTSGVVIPVDAPLVEEVFDRIGSLNPPDGEALGRAPQFALAIYRAAIDLGIMDQTRFV